MDQNPETESIETTTADTTAKTPTKRKARSEYPVVATILIHIIFLFGEPGSEEDAGKSEFTLETSFLFPSEEKLLSVFDSDRMTLADEIKRFVPGTNHKFSSKPILYEWESAELKKFEYIGEHRLKAVGVDAPYLLVDMKYRQQGNGGSDLGPGLFEE